MLQGRMIPALAGHNFEGWFDQEIGGTEWQFSDDVNPKAVESEVTLHAQWTRLTYNSHL